jgi:hypothetical protein
MAASAKAPEIHADSLQAAIFDARCVMMQNRSYILSLRVSSRKA